MSSASRYLFTGLDNLHGRILSDFKRRVYSMEREIERYRDIEIKEGLLQERRRGKC